MISCYGDATITGTIDIGPVVDQKLDPFSLDCNIEHTNAVTVARTYAHAASQVQVTYDPQGARL